MSKVKKTLRSFVTFIAKQSNYFSVDAIGITSNVPVTSYVIQTTDVG